MDLKTYRKDFSIFVYNTNVSLARWLKESLAHQGYDAHFFTSADLMQQSVYLALPHVVVVPMTDELRNTVRAIKKVSQEILVMATGELHQQDAMIALVEQGWLYDFCVDPVTQIKGFQLRVDRAIERWMLSLVKETKETAAAPVVLATEVIKNTMPAMVGASLETKDLLLTQLLKEKTEESVYDHTARDISKLTGGGVAILKHDAANEAFSLAFASMGLTQKQKDLGIGYGHLVTSLKEQFLRNPSATEMFKEFFSEVFQKSQTTTCILKNDEGAIFGLVVCLSELDVEKQGEVFDYCRLATLLLDNQYKSKLIFDHVPYERKTFCLGSKGFYEKLLVEVSRARRLNLPVSVITFVVTGKDADEFNRTTQLAAKILKRFTRVTDVIGRVSDQQFSVIFPHTAGSPSAQKAARLLSIMKAAIDEKQFKTISVRAGVSEFPQASNDSMSLLHTSESACDKAGAFEVNIYDNTEAQLGYKPIPTDIR
ncbi:MAG: diguanylate cyclase [Bdellovibrionales bacterium]|nr:diguanylate cyclase [Bdellovibrionales bacterium]